jgi:phage terminase Nu1 subunit (DNA packaging protein)
MTMRNHHGIMLGERIALVLLSIPSSAQLSMKRIIHKKIRRLKQIGCAFCIRNE